MGFPLTISPESEARFRAAIEKVADHDDLCTCEDCYAYDAIVDELWPRPWRLWERDR